jgi:PhnB protein
MSMPNGWHTLTPSTIVRRCAEAIEFYKKAFGAEVRARYDGPGGKVAHCELQLGDSILMMGDTEERPFPALLHLYVDDSDAVFDRAVKAGATVKESISDKFYGDRSGRIADPFGNEWVISTHVEDVSEAELHRRMEALGHGGKPS